MVSNYEFLTLKFVSINKGESSKKLAISLLVKLTNDTKRDSRADLIKNA